MNGELTFACLASPGRTTLEAAMFTESLRDFGGRHSAGLVRVFTPETAPPWPGSERQNLEMAGIELVRFAVPPEVQEFPFGAKVLAAAAAEKKAAKRDEILVWLDSDSLILSEPRRLRLAESHEIGCRPVDHILIGSPWNAPVEPFWRQIFRDCGVLEDRLFPISTSVDQKIIRPYFNAGFLVIRPAMQVLQSWALTFESLFHQSRYQTFYDEHILYRIFFHQAVLAGVLLAAIPEEAVFWLPPDVNYPLHMHAAYPANKKPNSLEELTTARYDLLFEKPGWESEIPLNENWRTWLNERPRVKWGKAHQIDVEAG